MLLISATLKVRRYVSQASMIRVIETPLDHFFGDHEGKVGRLRADFLDRLSAFLVDFAGHLAFDPPPRPSTAAHFLP